MKILVVHEVNYLSKIIYEFQILPEILSLLGHQVNIIDYNDSWRTDPANDSSTLRTRVYPQIHRAYPLAAVTVRRPGMIRKPLISRLSGAATAGIEVLRFLKQERPDAVLLYGLPTVGMQTVLAARMMRVPVVFRAIDVTHELVPHRALVPITRVLERLIFNSVDFNIALTPHLKQYISCYGVADERIRLLPSGVDGSMFCPGAANRDVLAKWGITGDDRVILFMGTIYPFSGLDFVIREFRSVLSQHRTAKLLIVGTGEDEQRLRLLAAARGVDKQVVFTGLQPYSILPEIIRCSDVCINPFELNGITTNILPTKLFQYLACGKPVLATPLPGTVVFLAGEEHGIVYSPLHSFNARLSELLSRPKLCKELGERGHHVANHYDWVGIARQIATWLGELART